MLVRQHSNTAPRRATTALAATTTIVSALSLGVALGITWMLVALVTRQSSLWLTLPAGLILGWVMRWGVGGAPWLRGLGAGLATLVAALWVSTSFVALQVGADMGLGLRETVSTAGIGLLWQLLQLSTSPADGLWCLFGVALATIIASGGTARR